MAGRAKLTAKQKAFVQEYLIDLNATQAAIRAGYSKKNADKIGPEVLGKTRVQAALQAAMDERAKKLEITPERVLLEIARLAFSDMRNYSDWGPTGVTLKDSSTLTVDQAAAVAEVSKTETKDGGSLRFKLHDKKGNLEMLAKHLGMLSEKHIHTGPDDGPIETKHTIDLEALSVEELKFLERISRKRNGGEPPTDQ